MNFNQVLLISISTQHFILQIIRFWRKWQAGGREMWRQVPVCSIQVRQGFRRPLGMTAWLVLRVSAHFQKCGFFSILKYIKPRIWGSVLLFKMPTYKENKCCWCREDFIINEWGMQLIIHSNKYHVLIKFMEAFSSRHDKEVIIPLHLDEEEVKIAPIKNDMSSKREDVMSCSMYDICRWKDRQCLESKK